MHREVWNRCLEVIRDNVPSPSFKTWFEPIVPVKLDKSVLTIQVPSPFFYEYLEEQYIDLLRKVLRRELGQEAKLEYNIVMDNAANGGGRPQTMKFPTANKTDLRNKPLSLPLDNEEGAIRNPFVIPGLKKLNVDPRLNHLYSFSNFVEGDCNRLARSAGYAVAQNPGGTAFNPLLLFGDSGLGKTHLAQAVGIEVKERFPEKTVLYVNANKFQTQFTDSIRNNTKNDFLHFYQMIDVLIIDDVHEFAGKDKTQDIFFHIFNHLHQTGKQLILTSDRPPVELQGMENRLLSRFKWGLSADLQIPDLETRIAILKKKIYNDGVELSEDVIEYIASKIKSNIRELEGVLVSLLALSTFNKREITLDVAKEMVEKLSRNIKRELSIDYIQKVVCGFYNIDSESFQSSTRKREIVQARQVAMFLSKTLTKSSLAAIGAEIGGKDHATVLHAFKTINNLMETDKAFKLQMEEIEKKLAI